MLNEKLVAKLPAIQKALLQLHVDTREWLSSKGAPRSTVARIDRATMRASLALELAEDGSRKLANLRRARDAMITYLNQLRFLCVEEYLDEKLFAVAERRVQQIYAGLSLLQHLDVEEWGDPQSCRPCLRRRSSRRWWLSQCDASISGPLGPRQKV